MTTGYDLAQFNVARPVAPMDSPVMAEFKNSLDRVNGIAEASDGFLWRLQDDSGNATDFSVPELDGWLLNLSVWRDVEPLEACLPRRAPGVHAAPDGLVPETAQASSGALVGAFTFARRFEPIGARAGD